MGVTLSQTSAAGFPDRGVRGLRVMFEPGNGGGYLSHDLGAAQAVLHVRLALAPVDAAGGAVRVAGGENDAGEPTWWMDYDAEARSVTVVLGDGGSLGVVLNALSWHVIELKLDTLAGEAKLWLNGVDAASHGGAFSSMATRRAWIGGVFKDTALSGELWMDEWVLATQRIGPVRVDPGSVYADDPARWLVVYNASSADAATWAEAYRVARGVPLANLLGLALSGDEVIDGAAYAALAHAINDYLSSSGLAAQVMGVLAGYRVPGYVDFNDDGVLDPVPALLHRESPVGGASVNSHAADALPTRPVADELAGDRMTARLDGPDLGAALSLIERGTALMEAGLDGGAGETLWFDPFAGSDEGVDAQGERMRLWVQSVDRMRLRLPVELSGDLDEPAQAAQFSAIHDDAFLWMWDTSLPAVPPDGFFESPAGKRVSCIQLHPVEPVATTLRGSAPVNWLERALSAGYVTAAGSSRGYSGSAVPYARPFFEALRRGWTVGEAWYVSLPVLREGLYLVGDPLARCALPRRGWDVFGPLDRLEALKPEAPSQALREAQTSVALPAALRPAAGESGLYVVRHVDGEGRVEAGAVSVRVVNREGVAARAPLAPMWPDHSHWPVLVEAGQVVLRVAWEQPLGVSRVARVVLWGEVDGAEAAVLSEPAFDPRWRGVSVALPMPVEAGRYRWRVWSADGVWVETPWSRLLRPRAEAGVSLQVWEEG